jgi:ubiquinone/menaquinone biosynthesis C-methylase UbiE
MELGARAEDIAGVDVSNARFDVGRTINPLVSMIQIDDVTLPFADGHFDLVTQWVCFMCIPSFDMRQMVANEMVRVLRPGGYIFWWDLPQTYTPSAPSEKLHPVDYFGRLHITEIQVSAAPLPSEGVRPLKGLGPVVGRILDFLGHRPSHIAALIGPKL